MKAGDFARARRMALLVRGLMALVAGLAFLVAGLAYDWYVCLTLGVLSLDASAPRLSAAARRGPAPGTGEAAPRPGRGGLLARLALPALLLILPPLAGWPQ